MVDFKKIENKWQKKWKENKIFQVEVDDLSKKKYYLTTPYPYMSGLLHLGHLFTYMTPEITARYKRMQGYNVLFKYGFHCTGTPLVAAAQRVKEKETKQIEILKKLEIEEQDIPKFEDPEHWARHFSKQALIDLNKLGIAIDERYTFITTSLNPPYDKFITWQFNKLKDRGYIKKGKHPVVWCSKCNSPVGDHARSEGEGETPQEFTLLKFKLQDEDVYLIAATLRPETVYGQTNLWLGADVNYIKAKVNDETWIVSKECIKKLKQQDYNVEIISEILGKDLIGKKAIAPGIERQIIILPAYFCDTSKGTGIVTSVPSDAPDDYIGLRDLWNNKEECEKYGLNWEEIKQIKPIPIINAPDLGDVAAVKIVQDMDIKTQHDREKLEKAKKIVYKKGFYEGVMNDTCGEYSGMKVQDAKDKVKARLLNEKKATLFYELTGKVVCRCLTECNVKIVSNQWFLDYGDEAWKKKAHKCLSKMKLWPEKVRKQFEYVIDWLREWACAREFGLGTKLPWDKKWIIESLSDSTMQMAYCTISKYLQHPKDYGFSIENIDDSFFDYVFLEKGDIKQISENTKVPEKLIKKMHDEFNYWYPFDLRNSAKDLIQNHLTFCIFNHTAILPEDKWPRAYALNGRIMVDNEKMSKSKGNFFTAKQLYREHGANAVRITAANAGEGINDANYDMDFLKTSKQKMNEIYEFAKENYNKGREEERLIDKWFESCIHRSIKQATESMENMQFKSALKASFFDLQRYLKWYTRRTNGDFNKDLINFYIESQIKLLTPVIPHFCEEIWELIGKESFISNAKWPVFDDSKIDEESFFSEQFIEDTLSDIHSVKKLAKLNKLSKVKIFIAPKWKYKLFEILDKKLSETRNFGQIMGAIMSNDNFKQYGKQVQKILPKFVKQGSLHDFKSQDLELKIFNEAKAFFEDEFNCEFEIKKAEDSSENKAKQALPGKVAILVE